MRSLTALRMVIHDRSSTAGSLLGVVAIVFLVGQQLSILFGLLNYMSVLVDHSGADAWIMSRNARNADAGFLISDRYIDRIIGLPEVAWAEPVLIGNGLFRTTDGSYESVRVVGSRRPRFAGGPWRFAQSNEDALLDLESVTVDRLDLDKLGNPGLEEITEIGERRVRVRAVTEGARGFQGTLVFASIEKVREIARTPAGMASVILVRFVDGSNAAATLAKLRTIMSFASVYSTAELAHRTRLYYFTNTGIGGSFGFSTVIAVLIGVVIISLTMYTSVLGRTQDFAVMRAIGGRKWDIAVVVFVEALIITGVGLFAGFLMLAALLNTTGNSSIPSYLPGVVPPVLAAGTLIVSLLGSAIALRTALKADPAAVFH
ncbi:MAG TPA: ABC transporter permease [Acidobacteriota bacterium]|mgnify:CR=1 FL=1|nr:FtsX-like permease family protein [Acidobacteriota bacterium]HOT00768.1 ABC transporter permease [Acidobacteriota bacterium]HQF87423.1 ABC transporter permease [Acidobacteriota bacterium]HQG91997.1 ABC transporter permease [Acidobacteriota bacterium]HQK86815.1 ABC transporter permease [Acidobacteriota bacterium]